MRDPFDGPPSGVILTPIEITCNRIVRRSSKYRNLKRAAKRPALRLWISRKNRLGGGHEETRRKSGGFLSKETHTRPLPATTPSHNTAAPSPPPLIPDT